ncbi:MAG: inorganic diphosphatase [Patescibacteria group bacterium]|jgi:inorganic pyrophosphatase
MDFKKIKLDPAKLPELLAFIEIEKDSMVKYEIDEETGFMMADRFLYTAMKYPFNYGFVPNTKGEDGDPQDIMVLSSEPVMAGALIKCKLIGMLEMKDEEGVDTKLIAVPVKKVDPLYGVYENIEDLPAAVTDRIKHFFDHYKELEPNKWVKTEKFMSKEVAIAEVKKGLKA